MIEKIIDFSVKNRFIVLLTTLFLAITSIWAIRHTPLDALPDLSPPQVIVQISYKGQSPNIIEDQVTYPLVSKFLSIANIETVRAFSTYENALIYIIFKEGTDLYWGRSRVLEQLASIQSSLPKGAKISLGPDASGVGWIYEYALVSKTKNLAELRTYQDYTLKYALMGIDGVSDVATVGGFVPNWQITIDNDQLVRHNLSIGQIAQALKANNLDSGGRIVIQNGYEWMVQSRGYIQSLEDIEHIVVKEAGGIPIRIKDIARVEIVPSARRGVAELDGQGETVGGIVMVRYKEDAYRVIEHVKEKLKSLKTADIDIVTTYDRSSLIQKAIDLLQKTLIEESLIVIVVIALFLMHLRSAMIVLIILPLTIALTFLLMKIFNIGSNIMSLGGIAIAIGAMVDASIVMIENAHKQIHKEAFDTKNPMKKARMNAIVSAAKKVGRPIFFALALVVISFLPIFALGGQEGQLFRPLAFTKTFAMSVGAFLAVTIVPILMLYFVKGNIPSEKSNPLNRFFIWLYHPLLLLGMRLKYLVLLAALAALAWMGPLLERLKWEFMPPLNEQTFMYMPVTPYGISVDLAKQILKKTDKIIKSFPEVDRVFGKVGRADTATDPAPLSMIETIITFKPSTQWRAGMDWQKLSQSLEEALQVPGLVNSWTYPIRGRIDMLLSGIRTPLGIKLFGDDATKLQTIGQTIAQKLSAMPETLSVFADQTDAGYYIDIDIDQAALDRYGVSEKAIHQTVALGIGGMPLTTLIKGLERYPISLRFQESQRRTLEDIKNLQVKTPVGFLPLFALADIHYTQSPSVIKTEMAKPVTFIYITPQEGVSASEYSLKARKALSSIHLPNGYYIEWAGQSAYLQRAMERITWIAPAVVVIILALIYFALKEIGPTMIVFCTLPFAMLGGLLYIDWLDFNMSVAVIVGFLALLGIAAETAIVMIVYLQESLQEAKAHYNTLDAPKIREAIFEGAVLRVRPKLMTVFAILAGLLPIMYAHGVGSEVMQRIAAPMIGGIVTSALLSLLIIPLLYEIYARKKFKV